MPATIFKKLNFQSPFFYMKKEAAVNVHSVKIRDFYPQSVTILPTYRCNAECAECCFESNPRIRQRLDIQSIKDFIDQARSSFSALKLIVFSGGEVFLLKDELHLAIAYARSHGLRVRCVTNGFWGKTERAATRIANKLLEAGVSEINISTGADHQEHVPFESVENACVALVKLGIVTLVTVEKDSPATNCLMLATSSQKMKFLLANHSNLFSLQSNSWMPFHEEYVERGISSGVDGMTAGCAQIFSNIVVTPYAKMAACCGLTFEHIPELTIGDLQTDKMGDCFDAACNDFLKIWIHLDGPVTILKKLFGHEVIQELEGVRHICQACAVLHLHPRVRRELALRFKEFVPEVMARFALKLEFQKKESEAVLDFYRNSMLASKKETVQ